MKKIYFVTGNRNKLLEAQDVLKNIDIKLESKDLPITEIQGTNKEIILDKGKKALDLLKNPCIVDDTSLEIEALNGLPGPYIKYFVENLDPIKMVKLLASFPNKKARVVCSIGLFRPGQDSVIVQGITEGRIIKPQGENGFGFDPIFIPEERKKTYAQMTLEEKNQVNHRMKALNKLKIVFINE